MSGPGRRAGSERRSSIPAGNAVPLLDLTIPVHNEERDLEECLRRLHAHLADSFPHSFRITVADNASTDGSLRAAERAAAGAGRSRGGPPGREKPRERAADRPAGIAVAGPGV